VKRFGVLVATVLALAAAAPARAAQ
jgi:hypothetical protein